MLAREECMMPKGLWRWQTVLILVLLSGVCSLRSAQSQTSDRDTKFHLAQGLEQAGEYERAAQLYKSLLKDDPANYIFFDALQRTWMQLKRYDDVIALLRERLARSPADVSLRAMLGSVYYRAGREKDAVAEWDAAIATDPGNSASYRLVASVLTENRLLDRSAEVYRRGRLATGDPNLFTLELASLLVASMDYAGATREYLRWLKGNPGQLSFVQSRIASFAGKEEARASASEIVRAALRDHEELPLLELLGWLEMEGKRFDEAFDVYRRIDALSPVRGTGLYQFAERAFKEKAYAISARAYQEAIHAPLPPARMPYARYGYAMAAKELSARADTLGSPIRGTPATEAMPLYGGAIELFRKIVEEYPRSEFSAKSYYQIGLLQYEKFEDRDGALISFGHVLEEVGSIPLLRYDALLMIGRIHMARGDTSHAVERFTAVAAATDALPDQSDEAVFHLAEIDYFGGHFDAAAGRLEGIAVNLKADYANDAIRLQAFLRENVRTAPKALQQYAHADFLVRQGKNTEAIATYRSVIEHYPQAPLLDDALMAVGSRQASAGLFSEAIGSYERLLTQFKETSVARDRAQFQLAEVYQYGVHDIPKAITSYEQLLTEYPGSILASQARKRIRQLRGETF